jgi:hypothetical protein
MNRLEFMACPVCSGHESIGADTAEWLSDILKHELRAPGLMPDHVVGELQNIVNMIRNAQDRAAVPENTAIDDDPLLA